MPRPAPTVPPPTRRPLLLLPGVIVVAAGLFAWWGVWHHDFVFDDAALRQSPAFVAGDWWDAAFGVVHQPLSNRPLACASLVLDFAIFGHGPFGPHLGNVVLHLLNGLLLLALARGVLLAPNLAGRFDGSTATRLATAIAAVWVAHPLGTDAVAYATQRSTLLFSMGLLVALLATLHAHGAGHPFRWRAVAVVAMALAMTSKEDAVVGPLLVVLFERAFLLPDWRALRQRRGYHGALAATWLVLAACVWLGPSNQTVGYTTSLGTTAWQWLVTQAGVVAWYVRLAVWPDPLRGAYDFAIVKELGPAIVPGVFVLALLAATIACWRRRLHWGWLGALFFLVLAPTSTVLPIVTEVAAERRVYLPMLAVIVPVVVGSRALLLRFAGGVARAAGIGIATIAVLTLGLLSRQHHAHYASEAVFWQDAFDKRDPDSRSNLAAQILSNQGAMLFAAGRHDEAYALFDLAMQCESPTPTERTHWATSLQQRGRHTEAVVELERVLAASPGFPDALGTLATCLLIERDRTPLGTDDPRLARAVALLQQAVAVQPRRVAWWNSLGAALLRQERWPAAEAAFAQATALPFEQLEPFVNRAEALRRLGRSAEVAAMWQQLLASRPRDVDLRARLAMSAMQNHDDTFARAMLQQILTIEPGRTDAVDALRRLDTKPPR